MFTSNQFGIVRAQVTDNRDPERLGRIRIRFPWLGAKSGIKETAWARMARGLSHAEAGDWNLPEIGDEVLVGFEFNKMERPVVLGTIYNEERRPPKLDRDGSYNENGKNNLRFLRTKSGHLLAFDDLPGSEALIVRDAHKNEIFLSEAGIQIKDSKGNQVLLSAKSDSISIKDTHSNQVELNSAGIKIKSSSQITIDGDSQISLGEGAAESLVKGNAFAQLFNAHIHPCPGGNSGPPQTPLNPGAHLSKKVKTS